MKLEDIAPKKMTRKLEGSAATELNHGSKRKGTHPEIDELLSARAANTLFDPNRLAPDELELAHFLVNKLDVDPSYAPSETLRQVVRGINKKLVSGSSLHGVIRTA